MAVDIETVSQIAQSYAEDVRCVLPVHKAFLFGSYTNGTATQYSDVDICFFLHSFLGKTKIDIMTDLLDMAAKYYKFVFIEPRAFEVGALRNGNPFVKEVLKTGYEI